jgi:hypothetical protein
MLSGNTGIDLLVGGKESVVTNPVQYKMPEGVKSREGLN